MVTRKKFKRKIKINYKLKLRPLSPLNTPPHSKPSRRKAVIAGFIKKFKTPTKHGRGRAPKGVKRYIWKRWSKKKQIAFFKFKHKLNRPVVKALCKLRKPLQKRSVSLCFTAPFISTGLSLSYSSTFVYTGLPLFVRQCRRIIPDLKTLTLNKMLQKRLGLFKRVIVSRYAWYRNGLLDGPKKARKRLKRLNNKFRKIKKTPAFISLINRQFYTLTGLTVPVLRAEWRKIRRGTDKYFGNVDMVSLFVIRMLMSAPNLLYLLGLTSSLSAGRALIKGGGLVYNGKVASNLTAFRAGDVFQFLQPGLMATWQTRPVYALKLNSNLLSFPFIHADVSLALIVVLRQPYTFEVVPSSFLSQRWVRYYIRQMQAKNKYLMENLFNLILIVPVFSFLAVCVFGQNLGAYGSMFTTTGNMLVAWLFSIFLFLNTSFTESYYACLYNWLSFAGMVVSFCLRYDSLTSVMFVVVTTVSSCVHVYSCVYMYTDPYLARFMSYLSLFTFFMLLLVSSSNLLVLFLGW